jgi:hypothetical protein
MLVSHAGVSFTSLPIAGTTGRMMKTRCSDRKCRIHSLPRATAPAALAAVGAGVSTRVLLLVNTRKQQSVKLPYMCQRETNGPVVAPVPLAYSVA